MFTRSALFAGFALLASATLCRADLQEILVGITNATRAGRIEQAPDLANRGVQLYPQSDLVYFMRAQIYEHRRLFDHAIKDYTQVLALKSSYFRALQRRGECHFKAGQFKESIADFDKYILAEPRSENEHWQRGISCYYAGEYAKGVRQFELRKESSPDDAENAIWHYVCNYRALGAERAKRAMVLPREDGRLWAAAAFDLFRGLRTPKEVLAIAVQGETNDDLKNDNLFHAHFYIALHHDLLGDTEKAREHLTIAVEQYPRKHYMADVARVHLEVIRKRIAEEKAKGEKKK